MQPVEHGPSESEESPPTLNTFLTGWKELLTPLPIYIQNPKGYSDARFPGNFQVLEIKKQKNPRNLARGLHYIIQSLGWEIKR
ncbi:hypothetical protein [Leptospira licerasiae]|uniref:hypothetical protein n=1 Tax=Leptospira licerasiae TaxID=447106 RepID=UPI0002488CD3|nr:hypothetical protein [Leptospira licerasiae]